MASVVQVMADSLDTLDEFAPLFLGEMAFPQYTGRVADWIMNEDQPDAFTEAITVMTLMTVARWAQLCCHFTEKALSSHYLETVFLGFLLYN